MDFDSHIWQPRLALLSHFSRNTEFKKPTTGCCFPSESEFTRAGNFQTKDSDFRLVITVESFFSSKRTESDRQANERSELNHRKSWF